MNIAIKSMIYCGYDESLLSFMVDYVHNNVKPEICTSTYLRYPSKDSASIEPPIDEFSHDISWNINQHTIHVRSSLMNHPDINGLDLEIIISSGATSKIFIPFGKLVATYGPQESANKIKIFYGNTEFVPEESNDRTKI